MTWTKQRVNNLFFFFGLAAVVVMMLTFDVSFADLWMHVCKAGYWLVPIVGIWLVIYAINALSWMSIIKGGNHAAGERSVSFSRLYRLTITGYALNYATPVGGLGGEPYRIMELSKDIGKERATSSVILYAMMHFFAHFWFWFISVFVYAILALCGNVPMNWTVGVTLAFVCIFCLLAFYVFSAGYRNGVALKLIRWIGKIPGLGAWSERFIVAHAEMLAEIDRQISDLHRQDRKAFYTSLILEYLSRVVQSSEVFFMLLLFGIDSGGGIDGFILTYLHSMLILAFTSLFANVMGFLPMQLGVQEGGFVISIAALGMSAAVGMFVSIICRLREIIWILVGILLMKIHAGNNDVDRVSES